MRQSVFVEVEGRFEASCKASEKRQGANEHPFQSGDKALVFGARAGAVRGWALRPPAPDQDPALGGPDGRRRLANGLGPCGGGGGLRRHGGLARQRPPRPSSAGT